MNMSEKKARILDGIIFAGSILAIVAPSTCLYGLHRVVKAMTVAHPGYSATSGTLLAYQLTVIVLISMIALSLVFLRPHLLKQMAVLNIIAGILIISFTMLAALTQILLVLPMTS